MAIQRAFQIRRGWKFTLSAALFAILTAAACIPNPDHTQFGDVDAGDVDPGDASRDGDISDMDADTGAESDAGDCPEDPRDCVVDPIIKHALGLKHTCAVRQSGEVWCWGSNETGQVGLEIGLEHTREALVPVRVEVFGPDAEQGTAVDIGGGVLHTCALTDDGKVWCWGGNFRGVLGWVVPPGSLDNGDTPVPQQVPLDFDAAKLATGSHFNCALGVDGEIWCWGWNRPGMLGQGESSDNPLPPTKVTLWDGEKEAMARDLHAAISHACAVTEEGDIFCWGQNRFNLISDESEDEDAVMGPTRVEFLSHKSFQRVWTGHFTSCALTDEPQARLFCWGNNEFRQIQSENSEETLSPVEIVDLDHPVEAALGQRHTCVREGSGKVYCIGQNLRGAVGVEDSLGPEPWSEVDLGGLKATSVVTDHYHTCVSVDDGGGFCWGGNDSGQLGHGEMSGSTIPVSTSLASLEPHQQRTLAVGAHHGCRLQESQNEGVLFCWGLNDRGQLGSEDVLRSEIPLQVVLPESLNAQHMALGHDFTCAGGDGGLACWGQNDYGQLGRGGFVEDDHNPELASGISNTIMGLAAGRNHACAIVANEESREVYCWGHNNRGQLGHQLEDLRAPWRAHSFSDVISVAAGSEHTCIVDGGEVHCWGNNDGAQLGDAGQAGGIIPVQVAGLTSAREVVAGDRYSCALDDAGEVHCWGTNIPGLGNNGSFSDGPAQVYADPTNEAVALSAGHLHACLVAAGGESWCWGDNTWGTLGLGHNAWRIYAAPVVGLDDAEDIAAGQDFSCALRQTGEVACWGNGDFGQLASDESPMAPHGPQRVGELSDHNEQEID